MTTRAPEPTPPGSGARRAPSSAARRSALSDLITGLLEARRDLASERFDAELDALELTAEVSPEVARLLRYWQRASVRAVVDHARLTLPPTLAALEEAVDEAARGAAEDAESWAQAAQASQVGAWPPESGRPTPTPASSTPGSPAPGAPTSLAEHRRRLLVAGLTRQSAAEDLTELDADDHRGHD